MQSSILLGLFLMGAQALAVPKEIHIRSKCEDRADCVVMLVHLDEASSVPVRVAPTKNGRNFYLTLKGKKAGEKEMRPLVLVLGAPPESELECSRFGDAVAAVAGFTGSGQPILLTDAGEIEVGEKSFSVGCQDCLRLLDPATKAPLHKITTPAWDLRYIGYKQEDFRYNDRGEVYLAVKGRCIRISGKQRFEPSPAEKCSSPLKMLGNSMKQPRGTGLILEPAEWLYKAGNSRLLMFLEYGACT